MSSTLRSTVSSRLSGSGSACSPLGALATASCDGTAGPPSPTSKASETTKRSQRAMVPPCPGTRPAAGATPIQSLPPASPRSQAPGEPQRPSGPDVGDLAVAAREVGAQREHPQPPELRKPDGYE